MSSLKDFKYTMTKLRITGYFYSKVQQNTPKKWGKGRLFLMILSATSFSMLPKSFASTLRFLLATLLLAKPLAFLHLWLLQVWCVTLSQLYLIFENQWATVSSLHTTFGLSVDFFFLSQSQPAKVSHLPVFKISTYASYISNTWSSNYFRPSN